MAKQFVVTTTGPIAHDIRRAYEEGRLEGVESLENDPTAVFSNKLAGLEPITTFIVAFTAQAAATITTDVVRKFLIGRTRRPPTEEQKVEVKEFDDASG